MKQPERIVLVGPMGAGKSTIGRLLARELGYRFLDTDKVIESRCGADIPWIFDVEGESGFRRREAELIDELTREPGLVLATGGGAILRPENRERLKAGSWVVYLKTSVTEQYERTRRDRNRPLLQRPDPQAVLQQLFEERDPLYESIANLTLRTDHKSPRSVVRQLVRKLGAESGDASQGTPQPSIDEAKGHRQKGEESS